MEYINKICHIIGMPRSGTTYLYHLFDKHPELFVPFKKEINYFTINYKKDIQWYNNFFKNKRPNQWGLDISPLSFLVNESWSRIYAHNKKNKIILILRDPNSWIKSYSKHLSLLSDSNIDPEYTFKNGIKVIMEGNVLNFNIYDGLLKDNVTSLKSLFKDNLLILDYIELSENPLKFLNKIQEFLNLKIKFTNDMIIRKKINSSNRKKSFLFQKLSSNKILIHMIRFFFPESWIKKIRFFFEEKELINNENDKNYYYFKNDLDFYLNYFK